MWPFEADECYYLGGRNMNWMYGRSNRRALKMFFFFSFLPGRHSSSSSSSVLNRFPTFISLHDNILNQNLSSKSGSHSSFSTWASLFEHRSKILSWALMAWNWHFIQISHQHRCMLDVQYVRRGVGLKVKILAGAPRSILDTMLLVNPERLLWPF